MPEHIPVLLTETLDFLQPERGGVFIDATLGLGGHSAAMLERAGDKPLTLIGIDRDPYALEFSEERLGDRVKYMQGNFAELAILRKKKIVEAADGILMDIGVSSYQIDTPERGFSFQSDGPLDMRMDQDDGVTAQSVVNTWQEKRLADMIYQYGEERLSRKIAAAIVERRRKGTIKTTAELAELIKEQYPPALRHKKPHPATRTFQAIRIEVNRELDSLKEGMDAALELLAPGGVLAIITFHSLEDRMVKQRFRAAAATGEFELLTKKPVTASPQESAENSRSRPAKLRAIRRA